MVKITSKGNYIKIDLTAFNTVHDLNHSIIYLMKDKAVSVYVHKEGLYVSIQTNKETYQLDMRGVDGFPAMVEGITPKNNFDLALELAELKNL